MKLVEPNDIPYVIAAYKVVETLDSITRLVLETIDGETTVVSIADICGVDTRLAQRIIQKLVDLKCVAIRTTTLSQPVPAAEALSNDAGAATRNKIDAIRKLEQDIDEMHGSLSSTNYYDLLGVEPEADRKEITRSYFELSKRFHPDRTYLEVSEKTKQKTAVVFRTLTKAYDTLTNSALRAEYNESISDELKLRAIEKKLNAAVAEKKAKSELPPKSSQLPASPPEKTADHTEVRPMPQSTASASGRQPISPRRPTVRSHVPPSPAKSASAVPPRAETAPEKPKPSQPPDYDERRKQLKKRRADRAVAGILGKKTSKQPPPERYKTHLDEATIAYEQEQYPRAAQILRNVLAFDPENEKANDLMAKVKAGSKKLLAKGYLSKGLHEKRTGQLAKAKAYFIKAVKSDPDNLDANHLLAEMLAEAKEDIPQACIIMQKVIALGGERARYFATLGELYVLSGDSARAKEAFERAVKLDPENKTYRKQLLKSCIE